VRLSGDSTLAGAARPSPALRGAVPSTRAIASADARRRTRAPVTRQFVAITELIFGEQTRFLKDARAGGLVKVEKIFIFFKLDKKRFAPLLRYLSRSAKGLDDHRHSATFDPPRGTTRLACKAGPAGSAMAGSIIR